MKLLVHDYAGHPFQVQLSRELARRGHDVTHVYAGSIETPRGALAPRPGDPERLRIEGLSLSEPFRKHEFFRRRGQELEYGRLLCERVDEIRPDWVISGNTPTEPQAMLSKRCRRLGVRFASWVQDFYGIAVHRLARRRAPLLGSLVGRYYTWLDRAVLRRSDATILIAEDFRSAVLEMGVEESRVHVIENWAPLEELPQRPRVNAWSEKHGLSDKTVFLYSGTLGMKHDPGLLLELAREFRHEDEVCVVVVSQGLGADWLRQKKSELGVDTLLLLPFQPFEAMPEVLASSEVLIAILEPDAGIFSVPSKVLTYLCAGRPILAAMPQRNLAARIITESGAGAVEAPDASRAFVEAGRRLLGDPALRRRGGANARRYAETRFDIEGITDRFLRVLDERPRMPSSRGYHRRSSS